MPQNAQPYNPAVNASGVTSPVVVDSNKRTIVAPSANAYTTNVTTASVVFSGAGVVDKVSVLTAPTAAGAVYDTATASLGGATNKIASIATADRVLNLGWPVTTGLVIDPGAGGGVVAVSYRRTNT